MLLVHDPRSAEYFREGHPERPARITRTSEHLRAAHPGWSWALPDPASETALLRAHTAQHLAAIRHAAGDFDADTPGYPGIFEHAARTSGAAVAVVRAALGGERAFSLMRPPGHHATADRAMGFCYFNHLAVAAFDALAHGAQRVAIWDFDAHHGNGTEAIVAGNSRMRFASVHQFPAYPGTGTRSFDNVINRPLAPFTSRDQHLAALRESLDELLAFAPDLLLVSAGFDAYVGDPLTQMSLEQDDFATLGRWLSAIKIPVGAILEGGYSDDLPLLVDAFLTAWDVG